MWLASSGKHFSTSAFMCCTTILACQLESFTGAIVPSSFSGNFQLEGLLSDGPNKLSLNITSTDLSNCSVAWACSSTQQSALQNKCGIIESLIRFLLGEGKVLPSTNLSSLVQVMPHVAHPS
jgi:hypothetical protein